VVAGSFAVMMVLVMVTTALAVRIFLGAAPSRTPPVPTPAYLVANLCCAACAAVLGGWLAAHFAPRAPLIHGIALAVLVALMSLASMRQAANSGQPRWYALVLASGMPPLVVVGAWLAWLSPAALT
jgi:hypothetical protein